LKINNYLLFKNNNILFEPIYYNRTDDTAIINLSILPIYISEKNSTSNLLFACEVFEPMLNTNLDSVRIITLSDYDNIKKRNCNINEYFRTYETIYDSLNCKRNILPLNLFKNQDKNPGILLVNQPTEDSVKLKIIYYLQNGENRITETKWLKFN